MTADSLAAFLLARWAEEADEANEAIALRDAIKYTHPPQVPDMDFTAFEDIGVPAVIVGPERVLADIEAKRRIVELRASWAYQIERTTGLTKATVAGFDAILRALAQPFADHPDFEPVWKQP